MLNIGVIGLGPDWETRHRPALARLARRIRIAAVYDAVTPRAERVADELRTFIRERLAHFKCPHSFTFVTELPKTATGKIQKFVLRGRRAAIATQ